MVQDCAIYACSAASMRHMPNTDWQAHATSLTLYDGRKSSAMASFIMEHSNVSEIVHCSCSPYIAMGTSFESRLRFTSACACNVQVLALNVTMCCSWLEKHV